MASPQGVGVGPPPWIDHAKCEKLLGVAVKLGTVRVGLIEGLL